MTRRDGAQVKHTRCNCSTAPPISTRARSLLNRRGLLLSVAFHPSAALLATSNFLSVPLYDTVIADAVGGGAGAGGRCCCRRP
jgi:hypothetical protein